MAEAGVWCDSGPCGAWYHAGDWICESIVTGSPSTSQRPMLDGSSMWQLLIYEFFSSSTWCIQSLWDIRREFVQVGNAICSRTCIVILVAICRSVCFFVEQPLRSAANFWPFIDYLMNKTWLQSHRTSWWLNLYEHMFWFIYVKGVWLHLLMYAVMTNWGSWVIMVAGAWNPNWVCRMRPLLQISFCFIYYLFIY